MDEEIPPPSPLAPSAAPAAAIPASAPAAAAPISSAQVSPSAVRLETPAPAVGPAVPEEKPRLASIQALLKGLIKHKASDLHVKVGRPPLYRVNGRLMASKMEPYTSEDVRRLAYSTMTQKQIKEFEENLQIDFGYLVPGLARFRTNVYMQKGTLAFVIRVVPLEVPVLETLSLPPIIAELALKSRGLLLVTGATGSGKSTTLAAIVEHINRTERNHIVTIEDPIEYIFEDKLSTVSQREVGTDALTLTGALRAALRQDPDVVMVGEMRDFPTIQTAITAAETGHLVVSSMHTNTAAQSIDRIIDSFPADAKNQLRLQLASSLVGVICQRLVKRADGKGRVVVCEILTKSPMVEKLIIENRLNEIDVAIESSRRYYSMQSMNQALEELVRNGVITLDEAIANSDKKEDLMLKMSGMTAIGQEATDAGSSKPDSPRQSDHTTDPAYPAQEDEVSSGIRIEVQEGKKRSIPGQYSHMNKKKVG